MLTVCRVTYTVDSREVKETKLSHNINHNNAASAL